jgi:hypothetical protein
MVSRTLFSSPTIGTISLWTETHADLKFEPLLQGGLPARRGLAGSKG